MAKNATSTTLAAGFYTVLFLILYACYSTSAYPQGDDVNHLLSQAGNALPDPDGWIANRVVDSFFNPFLFLLFYPINHTINGNDFFQSYSKYAGVLNAGIACLIVATTSNQVCKGLQITQALRLCVTATCLSFTLFIVYGDSTHSVAYNLTWVIAYAFTTSLVPISWITDRGQRALEEKQSSAQPILSIILAYFTAFGHELYALYGWIYLMAFAALSLTEEQTITFNRLKAGILNAAIPIQETHKNPKTKTLITYFIFSIISFALLLTSGRTNISSGPTPRHSVTAFIAYTQDFIVALAKNKATLILSLLLSITFIICAFARRASLGQNLEVRSKIGSPNINQFYFPFFFALLVNCLYFVLLIIAGFKDSTIFVSSINAANGASDRSLLFLTPIIILNLSICLRSALLLLNRKNNYLAFVALFSLVIILSCSFRFLYITREKMVMRTKVLMAFSRASQSRGDVIDIDFCLPNMNGNEGYPILPGEHAAEWYKQAHRLIFAKYYNRDFTEQGPVFREKDTIHQSCRR